MFRSETSQGVDNSLDLKQDLASQLGRRRAGAGESESWAWAGEPESRAAQMKYFINECTCLEGQGLEDQVMDIGS